MQRLHLHKGDERGVNRAQDSSGHGGQMRDKRDCDLFSRHPGKLLLYFRGMAVGGYRIGLEVFVGLGEVKRQVEFPPSSGGSRGRIHNDRILANASRTHQREQAQESARWITTRHGRETGLPDGLPIKLREPIDGFAEEVRSSVSRLIPVFVGLGVLQTKVRAEIDNPAPRIKKGGDWSGGCRMWQGQEDDLGHGS